MKKVLFIAATGLLMSVGVIAQEAKTCSKGEKSACCAKDAKQAKTEEKAGCCAKDNKKVAANEEKTEGKPMKAELHKREMTKADPKM